jgi:hypothetical protein
MSEEKEEQPELTKADEASKKNSRPLGLSLLLIFSFVYNGLLMLVMLAGLFYPDIVQNILQQYYKQVYISGTAAVLFTLAGTIVFGISFYGLILLWRYIRRGFTFYALAQSILLFTLVVIFRSYDYTNIAIALVVLVIFGLYAKNMK